MPDSQSGTGCTCGTQPPIPTNEYIIISVYHQYIVRMEKKRRRRRRREKKERKKKIKKEQISDWDRKYVGGWNKLLAADR